MTTVDQENERTNSLIEAFTRIGQFQTKSVIVSLNQRLVDDNSTLQDVLADIHLMQAVGIRPVVVHGPGQCLQRALQDSGFESAEKSSWASGNEAIMRVVEKSLALELNGRLADKFEKIGGRAMTLNFESTPVLTGQRIAATDDSDAERGSHLIAFGTVTKVDRLVIDNLCYAGQVPFIPAMCATEAGQKLLVNPDSAAATIAVQLNAEILVAFAEIPLVLSRSGGPDSRRLELNFQDVEGLAGNLTRELEYLVKTCCREFGQGTGRLIIADRKQPHSLLMNIFTLSGWGLEMVGA